MEQAWSCNRIRRARRRRGKQCQLKARCQRGLCVRRRRLVLQIHNKWLGVCQRMGQRRKRTRKVRRVVWGRSNAERRRAEDPALSRGRHNRHQVLQHNRIRKT